MIAKATQKWPTWATDAVLATFLFGAAMILRIPYINDVPRFSDEVSEILVALEIARGKALPLVNFTPWIGAFHNYLLAGLFVLTGPNPFSPRLMMAVFGALTVVVVYLWGRELGGRLTGFTGGALLALSATHIAEGSRLAYSHTLTPLFIALGFWLLYRALRRESGRAWLLCGLTFGVALQTHPTAGVFLLIAVIYALTTGLRWFRTPWPYLAGLLFLVGYGNVLVFNALTGGKTLTEGLAWRAHYAEGRSFDFIAYRDNLRLGLATLYNLPTIPPIDSGEAVAGSTMPLGHLSEGITHVFRLVFIGVVVASLLVAAARGYLFPALLVLLGVLLLPEVVGFRTNWIRYWMPLLPGVYVALGFTVTTLLGALRRVHPLFVSLAILALLTLAVLPLPRMFRFFEASARIEPTTHQLASIASAVADKRLPYESVLVDPELPNNPPHNTWPAQTLDYLLTFANVPHRWQEPVEWTAIVTALQQDVSLLVIVNPKEANRLHPYFEVSPLNSNPEPVLAARVTWRLTAPELEHRLVETIFDGKVKLLGYKVEPSEVSPGESAHITLYWQAISKMDRDYTVFAHLLDTDNKIIGQRDGWPAPDVAYLPTSAWRPGAIVIDVRVIPVNDEAMGHLRFFVGMYLLETGERLTIVDSKGDPVGDGVYLPTCITIATPG